MMGLSGSGKTSLLNILGHRAQGVINGSVHFGELSLVDSNCSTWLKNNVGYVMQVSESNIAFVFLNATIDV